MQDERKRESFPNRGSCNGMFYTEKYGKDRRYLIREFGSLNEVVERHIYILPLNDPYNKHSGYGCKIKTIKEHKRTVGPYIQVFDVISAPFVLTTVLERDMLDLVMTNTLGGVSRPFSLSAASALCTSMFSHQTTQSKRALFTSSEKGYSNSRRSLVLTAIRASQQDASDMFNEYSSRPEVTHTSYEKVIL